MKKIILSTLFIMMTISLWAQHNAGHKGKILMIASNPSISKQTNWPIGAWYSEVTHPYWAFTEAGYTVEIASP
ncbi:MAG: type 1 glutamine amidotransferase domain-containing protein, partial [Cytophagia bacterium]|nr:type 1 glutamine amidotransferase domain-containing protein [Cytophagia bacterium]